MPFDPAPHFAKRLVPFSGQSGNGPMSQAGSLRMKQRYGALQRVLNARYSVRAANPLAVGIGTPEYLRRVKRPSSDAGAFFMPAFGGRIIVRSFMAGGVREPQGSRSSGRSSNRAPFATPLGTGMAVTHYLRAAP